MARTIEMPEPAAKLFYEALETEIGGVDIYAMALLCAKNPDLREEWAEYREQTIRHVEIVQGIVEAAGLDPDAVTPGRLIVREKAKALLAAMQKALKDAPDDAEVVAAECVVDAENKDHKNWELMKALTETLPGELRQRVAAAVAEVEEQEDEHLYHTMGWARELSMQALGLDAVLPPPEEVQDVKSALGAARAKASRKSMPKTAGKPPPARPPRARR
jgi:hypothetical protein